MIQTHPSKKLGKLPYRHDPRTLKLADYIKALPPPPPQAGYIDKVGNFPMYLNDSIGDCVVAAAAHMVQQWTAYAGRQSAPTDGDVLRTYMAVSGYNPNDPSTDSGAVILDMLRYWRKTGLGGHRIAAFVSVNPKNHVEMKQAVALFGNCMIGIGLPVTAQNPGAGVNGLPVWSMPAMGPAGDGAPYSWGGHCVNMAGYGTDQRGNQGSEVVTWAQLYDMTWGFAGDFCDEAWAVVSPDWIAADGVSPSGFALSELLNDISQIK